MTTEIRPKPVTIPDDARCIKCGYALRELTELRCPECGQQFDPLDPFSMSTPQFRQRVRTAGWVPGLLFGSMFISLYFLSLLLPRFVQWRSGWVFYNSRLLFVGWIAGVLLIAWFIRTRARRSILGSIVDPGRRSEKWGRRLVALTALGIIIWGTGGTDSWECPHGRSVRFGPIVITRDSDHGTCNNNCHVWWQRRLRGDTFIAIAE